MSPDERRQRAAASARKRRRERHEHFLAYRAARRADPVIKARDKAVAKIARDRRLEHHRAVAKAWKAGHAYRSRDARRTLDAKIKGYAPAPPELECPTAPLLCEICGREPPPKRRLSLDHCHTTGKFRGWLCPACNTGMGFVDRVGTKPIKKYLKRVIVISPYKS